MVNIGDIATHPLVILIVGAMISSLLIPRITKRWQDHQKELEIKINLITKISEVIMKEVMSVQFMEIEIKHSDVKSKDFIKKFESTNDDYKQLEIESAIIGSQLIAYFHNDNDIIQTWNKLVENLRRFYANLQSTYNDILSGKVSDQTKWRDKREEIIEEKQKLIIEILKGHIKGL